LGCGETKEPGAGGDAGSATGGSSVAGKGGASQGGGAGAGGAGGLGSGGAGEPGVPLLDRPAELTYDCEVTRPMSLLGLNPWVGGGRPAPD
jgi:hypothetical protein